MRSQEEITYLAARWLQRQHSEHIAVSFHDLSDAETQRAFPTIVDTIVGQRWPLPVVAVDNRLTPLPFLSYWAIVDVVESVLAARGRLATDRGTEG